MELKLSPSTFARLKQYVDSTIESADAVLTSHWEKFGTLNRISFSRDGETVTFIAGAGFDDCYRLNFKPSRLGEWVRQKWIGWNSRDTARRFTDAFLELSNSKGIGLDELGRILGNPITTHKPLAAYYFNLIQPHLQNKVGFQYLEIGAGSGYLAALLHQLHQSKVIIIDLPKIIPFSFLYLTHLFPEACFQLPNEIAANESISTNADFVFLSPDKLTSIPDNTVDLAVNTASFGEMLPGQVRIYYELLRRTAGDNGLFFTANRVEKLMSDAAPVNKGIEVPVRFEDYPWSIRDRDLFHCRSSFHDRVQPHNPFMMRMVKLAQN